MNGGSSQTAILQLVHFPFETILQTNQLLGKEIILNDSS